MTLSTGHSAWTLREQTGGIGGCRGLSRGSGVEVLRTWGALETFCMKCWNDIEMSLESHRMNSRLHHGLWLINVPMLVDPL